MKKNILMAMLISLACIYCNAEERDTVLFKVAIEKVVTDSEVSAKGKRTEKYYFLTTDGFLYETTRTVAKRYLLCKKYNAKCRLLAVIGRKTREIKKIII